MRSPTGYMDAGPTSISEHACGGRRRGKARSREEIDGEGLGHGGAILKVEIVAADSERKAAAQQVVIEAGGVEVKGIGIPPIDKFEIVTRAVERMRGKIGVDSDAGKGAMFLVRLPA